MSRAFVNEDAHQDPEPRYTLPDPEADGYLDAVARALLQGAHVGDTRSAERATGYRWGDPDLAPAIRSLLEEAEQAGEDRRAQLARRYLRAVDQKR